MLSKTLKILMVVNMLTQVCFFVRVSQASTKSLVSLAATTIILKTVNTSTQLRLPSPLQIFSVTPPRIPSSVVVDPGTTLYRRVPDLKILHCNDSAVGTSP